MSADNWTKCPKCELSNKSRLSKAEAEYGKVSAEEYKRLLDEALEEKESEDTLRENYSIGIYHGQFEIEYSASCTECGFNFSYEFNKDPLTK